MPTYVYSCECGNLKEIFQPMSASAPECEECGSLMTKKPSILGVSFEGDGWGKDR